MEANEHGSEAMAVAVAEAEAVTTTTAVKTNNPKSALSYLEIGQIRKHAPVVTPSTASTSAADKYFCNNCNRNNHVYSNCRAPITSIGVIAFRCGESGPEFLMIRRRDSFGFVDFIRGKYSLNDEAYIQRIIDEMTLSEKANLMRLTFDQLWRLLWGEYTRGSQYKNEEHVSFEKYRQVLGGIRTKDGRVKNLQQFIDDS
ncbi:hypothetical protein EBR96_06760, partial [bacterium]|nr:hypothetical protein [bacterium]